MPIEFLSFPVQSGKTTWLATTFGGRADAFGFLTPGNSDGRALRLLPSGDEHPFAAAPGDPAIEIGRFRIDPRAFQIGLNQLHLGLNHPACRVLVADEIGPLELRQGRGFAPGLDGFIEQARRREDVVTYLVVRDFLLGEARARWRLEGAVVNDAALFRPLPPTVGVVLAGGESRRMGRDKAFIERGGQPAYALAAALLAPYCDGVLVSGRGVYPPLPALPDAPEFGGCGPLSGVLTAAARHPGAGLLVLGVDYPHLAPEAVERLVVAGMLSGRSVCYRQAGGDEGAVEPLVALYAAADLAELGAWHAAGRESLRAFLVERGACALPHDPRMGVVSVDGVGGRDLA